MTKMAKIDTLFMTKTAEKTYPLGLHIPIWPICIVYGIESAAYGVICTSCLCQNPERARYFCLSCEPELGHPAC